MGCRLGRSTRPGKVASRQRRSITVVHRVILSERRSRIAPPHYPHSTLEIAMGEVQPGERWGLASADVVDVEGICAGWHPANTNAEKNSSGCLAKKYVAGRFPNSNS